MTPKIPCLKPPGGAVWGREKALKANRPSAFINGWLDTGLFCAGEKGQWLLLRGGGKIAITGNLTNATVGSVTLYVNDGTTATMLGASTPNTSHGYKYCVAYGTLVLDNNNALTNNTADKDGTDKMLQSCFIIGAATNAFSGKHENIHAFAPPPGVLIAKNNSFNAAVYLGDANHLDGGLMVGATVTNYVSDGDDFIYWEKLNNRQYIRA